jgi:branched-chain amino acid transport system ATP-binding protein
MPTAPAADRGADTGHGHSAAPAVAATAPILTLNNVEVIYDHVALAIKGVSIEVPAGGMVALLGANGAGKSTT